MQRAALLHYTYAEFCPGTMLQGGLGQDEYDVHVTNMAWVWELL